MATFDLPTVKKSTLLSFAAEDQSLFGDGPAPSLAWSSEDALVFDTGPFQRNLIDFDAGFLGKLKADVFLDLRFGFVLNAGLGAAGAFETDYKIQTNVEFPELVLGTPAAFGEPVLFDFTDTSVISANSSSDGLGTGVGFGDDEAVRGISLELAVGATAGFRNIEYRLPFGSEQFIQKFDLFDFQPEENLTLFKLDVGDAQASFELSDEISVVLRVPTGADTEGESEGSTIVSGRGFSPNPFIAIEGDLDALLVKLIKTIPGAGTIIGEGLETTVFANYEEDLKRYIPFLPPETVKFEATVVDIVAAAGLKVTETVTVDLSQNPDANTGVLGDNNIVSQFGGLLDLISGAEEQDPPGSEALPNVRVTLRSDAGTPDDPSDDSITTGFLGEVLELDQPNAHPVYNDPQNPRQVAPGLVTVDAFFDVESARVNHAVGIGGSFEVTIAVLSAGIGGSIGEKFGISFGPLFETTIPEDGLNVDLFEVNANSFELRGGRFDRLPGNGALDQSNADPASWQYQEGDFNQQRATYEYFWTNVTPPNFDPDNPPTVAEFKDFIVKLARWEEDAVNFFEPLIDLNGDGILGNAGDRQEIRVRTDSLDRHDGIDGNDTLNTIEKDLFILWSGTLTELAERDGGFVLDTEGRLSEQTPSAAIIRLDADRNNALGAAPFVPAGSREGYQYLMIQDRGDPRNNELTVLTNAFPFQDINKVINARRGFDTDGTPLAEDDGAILREGLLSGGVVLDTTLAPNILGSVNNDLIF